MEQMDVIDLQILQALSRNGRMSWQELADHLELSVKLVINRVRRLEDDKYILGYAATVNERAMGHSINAIVFIELERQSKEACEIFEAHVIMLPAVRFCGKVTGKPDYIANMIVDDMDECQRVLNDIGAIPGVAKLRSNMVLKLVRPYGPPRPVEAN